ncbi:HAMP domain-containing histidine kinase [Bacillus tianshenii]|nr:HAMP domain-containing histidine kinase [Bacillus tianshenii]
MKRLRAKLSNLKIKWKLALGAALLLSVLFLTYNVFQFLVMNNWIVRHEQQIIENHMQELQAYYQDKQERLSPELIHNSATFVTKVNEKFQSIRIIDNHGKVLLSVSDGVPESWVQPENTTTKQVQLLRHGEDRLLIVRTPLMDGSFVGTIEIVKNLETLDELINQSLLVMIATGIGAIILSLFGGVILAKHLLTPVREMSDTVDRIKKHGLKERVHVSDNHDEISELALHFNGLMDQIEASFEQQRQFVEDASHELRTPLQVMKGHLSMIDRWGKDDPAVLNKSLKSSLREVDRLTHLVQDLLELSRLDSERYERTELEQIEVAPVIKAVVKNFEPLDENYVFRFEDGDCSCKLLIRRTHLEQLLVILLDNAMKYSSDVKQIDVRLQKENDNVEIAVQDYGIGIPEDELPHVFERFYRVEKSRNRKKGGYGIGLSIAKRITEKYDGSIQIESELNQGTSVIVTFPVDGS